ncbi:Hypothetical predicted protein, partial [Pelobates cultripes]
TKRAQRNSMPPNRDKGNSATAMTKQPPQTCDSTFRWWILRLQRLLYGTICRYRARLAPHRRLQDHSSWLMTAQTATIAGAPKGGLEEQLEGLA